MAHKDEVFEHYKADEAWWKTQKNVKIKCLRSDRGGEYMSKAFNAHLANQGTIGRLTVHDTPEYNGVSEQLNRTLLNMVRTILSP
jgi:transposase InsO family protein